MTNLDSIFKSRDITLPTKVHLVKTMVFPVVLYRCETWTVKKAECWRIDAFELWCWRRPLRVQSILKKISPGCFFEGMMLKLKLQYFGHLMWRVDSLEKTLMLGGIGGRRKRGWQRMRWLDGITNSMDMSLSELRELVPEGRPGVLWFMELQRVRHDWATELNWYIERGFPGGVSGNEPTWQWRRCNRCGFDPCVRKISWTRAWQSTPVSLPGESHRLRSPVGYSS